MENCTSIPKLTNSDHLGLFFTLKKEKILSPQRKSYQKTSLEIFISRLIGKWSSTRMTLIPVCQLGTRPSCKSWKLVYPFSSIKVKGKIPWINKEIIRAITKRNILFKRSKLSNQAGDAKRFKNQRNLVVSMIRKSKKNFDRLNTKDDNCFGKQ